MEGVSGVLLHPLLQDCSVNGLARQELLPRQNCWPAASPGKGHVPPGRHCGDDQDDHVPAQSQKTCFCCHCLQRRQVLALLGEADQSQPDPQQSPLPDTWPGLVWSNWSPSRTPPALSTTTIMTDIRRPMRKEWSESLIIARIFFLCFLVLGWPGQVDKLLKKGKYHFILFLQLIMANHRKADSNSRLAIAL